jgi:hypothetical protein
MFSRTIGFSLAGGKYRFWQPPYASGIRSIFARSLGVGTSFTKGSGGDVYQTCRLLALKLARPASTVQFQPNSPCQLVTIWSMDAHLGSGTFQMNGIYEIYESDMVKKLLRDTIAVLSVLGAA